MKEVEWKIHWSESLSVGVSEIDEEHQQFVARVNELNQAIVEGRDKATVERLLDLMLMEAAHHFWDEQRLLAQWKYPGLAAHTATHARLIAQFERVMREFEQTDISFTWALKGLHLKQLLVDHLLQEDMKYRDFLRKSKGVIRGAFPGARGRRPKPDANTLPAPASQPNGLGKTV